MFLFQIPFGVHLLHVSLNEKTPLAVGDIVQPKSSPCCNNDHGNLDHAVAT